MARPRKESVTKIEHEPEIEALGDLDLVGEFDILDEDLEPVKEEVSAQNAEAASAPREVLRNAPAPTEYFTQEVAEPGWLPIEGAIRSGLPIRVSETPSGEGTLARWKRTRAFANATHRWEATGKWEDFITGQEVSFQPRYWKPRFEA